MHAGKLSHGILKPRAISIDNIVGKLFFCLFEELNLLGKFPLHLTQLSLALGGPLLHLGHLGLDLLYLLLQINHFVKERQDLRLRLKRLLRLLEEKPLGFLLRLSKARQLPVQSIFA